MYSWIWAVSLNDVVFSVEACGDPVTFPSRFSGKYETRHKAHVALANLS